MITPNLVAWQWETYPLNHVDRRNLLLHVLSWPLWPAGLLSLALGFWPGGLMLLGPLLIQGRGHGLERNPPIPFRSPLDFVARFTVEQSFNFPRFVLTGGWLEAWRRAGQT